jgi:aspartyl-tRNA(Asn)/glutamyl-tRNA(Gln) amidotransferase subunit C
MAAKKEKKRQMNVIGTEMVKHVALLVRLGIADKEAHEFSQQFNAIIDYFHMLNEVDTRTISPANSGSGTESVLRTDEVKPSMSREEFLKNAPQTEGTFIRVPGVFDED